jgi:hypothetical protein
MIAEIEEFLSRDSKRAIDVYANEDSKIGIKLTSEKLKNHGGLHAYLVGLQTENPDLEQIYIQQYIPNGSSGDTKNFKIHKSLPKRVRFEKTKISSLGGEAVAEENATVKTVAPPASIAPPSPIDYGMQGMLGVHLKAEKYELLKEAHLELKENYKELKSEHKTLEKQHLEDTSRIVNFEKEQTWNQKITEASVKKTDVSEVLDKASPMLIALAEGLKQKAPIAAAAGLAGVEIYSASKQELLKLVLDEQFTDQDCFDFVAIFTSTKINPDYLNELKILNELHNINQHIK